MTPGDNVSLIKDKLTIVDVVSRYAQLKPKGNRMAACCPFHQEKTPSFYVDPRRNLYHCFGCGKGGDLIHFTQEIEGLSFRESLDFLADLAGIELPHAGRKGPGRDVLEGLKAVYAEATSFYQAQLRKHAPSREYLKNRGIRENTAKLFRLGYASAQWDGLFAHLKNKFEPRLLTDSGLFKQSRKGNLIDLFRERLMFPIHDAFGNVIAFGGRLINAEEGPKYINSPENPLYTKGKHLFNLHFAKTFLKKQPELVVVEGYMDAIQVYQAGIGAVIASLGTAFTADQARLIKRYAKKVLLNFDADPAGFKAARASIETCLKRDLAIGVVTLPDKQDPDDFIKHHGLDAYRERLAAARGFYDFLLAYLSQDHDLETEPRNRSFVLQEICQTLHQVEDPVVRAHYLEKLSKDLKVSDHVVDQVFHRQAAPLTPPPEQPKRETASATASATAPAKVVFTKIEQEFLFQVMHGKDYRAQLKEEHRAALPKVLNHVFRERPWVLDFIHAGNDGDFETALAAVPDPFNATLRSIYFSEAFDQDNSLRLEELFPELLKQMLVKLVRTNKNRLRALPPHEEEKKKILMRQNSELMKQFHRL